MWAALQIVAIGLAACRIPLAAQYPIITEFYAGQVLLAVQLPLAAMLMPVLLAGWRSTVAAALLAGLMQCVASLLTDVAPLQIYPSVIYVTLWVVALGLVCRSLRGGNTSRLIVGGGIGSLVAGGALLGYMGADLSSRSVDPSSGGPLFPLLQNWPTVPVSARAWLVALLGVALLNRLVFQAILLRSRRESA